MPRLRSISDRRQYPSDVSQSQWDRVDQVLPVNRMSVRDREMVNAINYRWMTGCSWRMLPHDFPNWATVYAQFRQWQRLGLLPELRRILVSRPRRPKDRTSTPGGRERLTPKRRLLSRPVDWKRDDFGDRGLAEQPHQQPIETHRYAGTVGQTGLQRGQQTAVGR